MTRVKWTAVKATVGSWGLLFAGPRKRHVTLTVRPFRHLEYQIACRPTGRTTREVTIELASLVIHNLHATNQNLRANVDMARRDAAAYWQPRNEHLEREVKSLKETVASLSAANRQRDRRRSSNKARRKK